MDTEIDTGDILRVDSWDGYVGQQALKDRLRVHIDAALRDERRLDHILLEAPPGYGKTSMAQIVADELYLDVEVVKMPIKTKALANLVRRFDGGVIVLDEIHRGSKAQQEDLLPLLEQDFVQLDTGRKIYGNPFTTYIGCTTEPSRVIKPLRDRFPIRPRYRDYTDAEMATIIIGMGEKIGVQFTPEQAAGLGGACAGTPRQARTLVLAARDLHSTDPASILAMCEIDEDGLTADHVAYLQTVDDCGGIGVGLPTINTMLQLPEPTIREIERLLLKRGLIQLEKTGRELTNKGFAKVNRDKGV